MQRMPGRWSDLLIKYLGPQWRRVLALAAPMLASIALQLVNPRILGRFIDSVQTSAPTRALVADATAFLVAAAIGQAAAFVVVYLSANVGWRATNALRHDLASHVLTLDMNFHKAHTPGSLIERIDGDVGMLAEFFSGMVVDLVSNSMLGVGILVALALIDWRVGLIGIGYAALVLAVVQTLQRPTTEAWQRVRQADTALFSQMSEHLYGMEDIRSSGAATYVMQGLHHLMDDVSRRWCKAKITDRLQGGLGSLISVAAQVLVLALSVWLLQRGEVTLGTIFAMLNYVALLKQPVSRIQRQAGNLQRATAGINRICALLDTRPQITRGGCADLPKGPLGVAFRRVTFHYRDDSPSGESDTTADARCGQASSTKGWTLRDLSFELGAGRVLGILGRTGSGKSTVAHLLFRLYDPDDGAVLLAGIDLRSAPIDTIRQRIGLVTQDVRIFRASVRDNLTLFSSDVSDSRLHEALGALGLDPWLASLPDGLDTKLEPGSEGVSAGEAQLLDLTRICLRDPDIVILDEASARLDPVTERLLDAAIDRLTENRSAIIIAHRLATIQRADDIMILERGACVELGERHALATDPDSRFSRLLQTGLQEVLA